MEERVSTQSEGKVTGKLLKLNEREALEQLAKGESPHSQRAQALLALDEGTTQSEAGNRSGLTGGQVKYWLGKYRKEGLGVFPEAVTVNTETQQEPTISEPEGVEGKIQETKQSKKTKTSKKIKKSKVSKKKPKSKKKKKKSKKSKKSKTKQGKSGKKSKKK